MPHINKTTATVKSIKFLGLTIDTILNWKHHISDLKPRLNKACFAITSIKPFMSLAVLKSTYYSYAHSIMSYGLTFWGNSTDSDDIFKIPKRIIRIITNSNKNASCRELFKKLNILPLQSQYIQGDSGGICTTLGNDSMSDSKQKKVHMNMGPILNGYGVTTV